VTFSSTGGITKKRKKVQLKRSQIHRAQKALERADIVADRLQVKVHKSEGRSKVIKHRKKEWEDVNHGIGLVKGRKGGLELLEDMAGDTPQEYEGTVIPVAENTRYGDGEVLLDPPEPEIALPLRTTLVQPNPLKKTAPQPVLQTLDDIPDI
jgi:Alb1 domain-containing protein